MQALWFMLLALVVLAIAYRYYSAFLAAKVLALDDARVTPAHRLNDGQNYHPTNKWVLFGHHFAAITGAGPLVGPVLAAQFGFLPGFSWILIGVCVGGAVHDFVVLASSVRRDGRSLAVMAREELGPVVGFIAGVAILFIVVIAIAGLGRVVVGALAESAWGVFAIGTTIPLALLMGLHIYKVRGGSARGIREASVVGVAVLLLAVVFGKHVQDSSFGALLTLSQTQITLSIAAYGFVASVLPVWMLLCPRDYLSSYMKIGTIALLVVGILVVNPTIEMPLVTQVTAQGIVAGGATFLPVVKGSLFPFIFITIACGAISGFHALVGSGTTPKMIDKESDARAIGYGAMLVEGLVGITALIAAVSLPPADYFAINTDPKIALVGEPGLARTADELRALPADDRKRLGIEEGRTHAKLSEVLHLSNAGLASLGYHADVADPHASELTHADFARLGVRVTELPTLSAGADEVVAARTGGAVSLAVGMARVFAGLPGAKGLLAYWYHFVIMFEALFILTTIDTGTRVGRFLLQEFVGRFVPKFGDTSWWPGALLSTALVVAGWSWFILSGEIATIWPMFGIANQLLAAVALTVGTTILLREAKKPIYALVTAAPLAFVGTTTLTAGTRALFELYWPMTKVDATRTMGFVNLAVTSILLLCVVGILGAASRQWWRTLRSRGVVVPS
jgi:carbon starvation protein